MSTLFEKKKAKEAVSVAETFIPDGQVAPDGSVRYKILCDGGFNPSGVFWTKTVPPGASVEEIRAVQAERDEALARLKALTTAA